jgi:hypothetical protein
MVKKYVKGKDGKFKGSIADPNGVPEVSESKSIPVLPNFSPDDRNAKRTVVLETLYKQAKLKRDSELNKADKPEPKPELVSMSAKNVETQEIEELEVINPSLRFDSMKAQQNCLVRIPLEDIRFMDRDKITAALGSAIMGSGYSMSRNILTYKRYAENSEYAIYRVDIQK